MQSPGGDPEQPLSLIGVPLLHEERVRGALTLSKLGAGQFDGNALRVLEIVAAQAAIAFDRARLYAQLRVEAITDPLVKIANRRYLLERYREERARALRNGHPLACLIMDVDGFKAVNDTHGHGAGDLVLCELAGILRTQVRTEDVAARYGGEEFCILLPESSQEQARVAGERIVHAIAQHRMPPAAGVPHITVSVGLGLFLPQDTGTEMFARADHAMYRAKAAGGNRLCV